MNVLDEKYGTRLLDEPMGEVEKLVERIADAQLLEFSGIDRTGRPRYRFHDLVRLFACERGQAEDRPGKRVLAFGRIQRHWLALIGMAEPQIWLETEQHALVIAVQRFAELGLDDLCCELAAALASSWFRVHNRFEEWERTHRAALAAAEHTGNRRGQAVMLNGLGQLHYELDKFEAADEFFRGALDLARQTDDYVSQAAALAGLGSTRREQGYFVVPVGRVAPAPVPCAHVARPRGPALPARRGRHCAGHARGSARPVPPLRQPGVRRDSRWF